VAKPVWDLPLRARLEALWSVGQSVTQIAGLLDVSVCAVSRELSRYNSARHGTKNPLCKTLPPGRARVPYRVGYRADWAQRRADAARKRPKAAKLVADSRLRHEVVAGLGKRLSPRQIARWLAVTFPDQPEMQVSHETIYQAIYVQSRGNLRAALAAQLALRSGRAARKPQARTPAVLKASRRAWIGELLLSARPAEATDRAVPGHWEGDLVIGARGSSAIITLVERRMRYVMLGALPQGRDSAAVIDVLQTLAGRLPQHLLRSLTWDQGTEMAQHAAFTVATGCPVYFCEPHKPWQRGSNENTNGLLRQYFPKGKFDFTTIDQAGLDEVAYELNQRPRMTLDWYTPAERLHELLTGTLPPRVAFTA
jgi:transposase, IS30 family